MLVNITPRDADQFTRGVFFVIVYLVIFCYIFCYFILYNNQSYPRILIGSRLWSIRGQTRLTSSPQSFSFCILKWRKVLRNKIIFCVTGWRWNTKVKGKVKKSCFFFREWEYSSSLSLQLSETKPNTRFILLCLEFNKSSNIVFVTLIYLKNSTFPNLVDTDWCQEWNIKSSLLQFS